MEKHLGTVTSNGSTCLMTAEDNEKEQERVTESGNVMNEGTLDSPSDVSISLLNKAEYVIEKGR